LFFGNRISFAVFGDEGPKTKLGEASIMVHRQLGFERIREDGSLIDAGIDANVTTIVFPGSGRNPALQVSEIEILGKQRFNALGGQAP
jgi:hypothetical protein